MSTLGAPGRGEVPEDLVCARLVTTSQVLQLNERARDLGWATIDPGQIASRLDPVDRHCIYPMLRIGGGGSSVGCRCYLWFRERQRNSRTLILVDVSDDELRSFPVIAEPHLHLLVGMLLAEIPLVLLSEREGPARAD
jgi:hypothetical protein